MKNAQRSTLNPQRVGIMGCVVALLAVTAAVGAETAWRTDLWLGRGNIWRKRVPVTVTVPPGISMAEGEPVAVPIGDGKDALPIVGVSPLTLRVTDDVGEQLLYAAVRKDGEALNPFVSTLEDAELLIPLVRGKDGTARYWVYFDNRDAWELADSLPGEVEKPVNGDFELGEKTPVGWKVGELKNGQRLSLSDERPFSGKRCLKAESPDGLAPSWFGWKRGDLRVVPGAEVTIRVRVRGEKVTGTAGWYVHIGNERDSQIVNRVFKTGDGTFDWREEVIRLKVPEGCTRLSTGSVLYGSGTAWYDAFSFDPGRERKKPTVTVGEVERLDLRTIGEDDWWLEGEPAWRYRIPIRLLNPSDHDQKGVLSAVDVHQAAQMIRNPRFRMTLNGKETPMSRLGGRLLFLCDLPARSLVTYHLYVASSGTKPGTRTDAVASGLGSDIPSDQVVRGIVSPVDLEEVSKVLANVSNRVKNSGFEEGEAGWTHSAVLPGVRFGVIDGGCFGKRCAEFAVSDEASAEWRGWYQSVPVEPGHTYLYGGWIAVKKLTGAPARIYAHLRDAEGKVSESGFLETAPVTPGTSAWMPAFATVRIPEGVTTLQVHLTMNERGTLHHDGVLVTEFVEALVGDPELSAVELMKNGSAPFGHAPLQVWRVDPIIKVFPQSLPEDVPASPLTVSLARNETEALQVAVRAPWMGAVTVEVEPPRNAEGKTLTGTTVGWVDYVPIDYPTAYYNCKSPPYVLKVPTSSGESDGWSGRWPDPITPSDTTSVNACETRSAWITFTADAATAPGEYRGTICWKRLDRVIRRDPLTVKVWGFTLPERPAFPAVYDLRFSHWWDLPGEDANAARHRLLRFMAEKKICPDAVPAEVTFRRDASGKITADFSAYDAMAALYFDTLQFPVSYMPSFFYLFGWEHPPKDVLGEKPFEGKYPYTGVDRTNLRPAYREAFQRCLRLYWDHVKAKGWSDRLVLYISDEPFLDKPHIIDQMKALCAMVHEVDPAIRIYCSTWRHQPAWNESLDIWGVGHYGCFPVEEMKARRDAGQTIWFTTDGQMCTDTPYCAVERLLPHYAYAYHAEAYEFWGCTWLTYNPWRFGWHRYIHQVSTPGEYYYVRYPNGDGYLIYPGAEAGSAGGPVTSIRLEAARDGVEDYAYLHLLEALAAKPGEAAKEAAELLAAFRQLVTIPNAGGRYSTAILPEPERLGILRERAGNLLDRVR